MSEGLSSMAGPMLPINRLLFNSFLSGEQNLDMKHSPSTDGPSINPGLAQNKGTSDLRILKVQQLMRENLDRKLPLGELADAVNLSVWRLCHIFRSETGMAPIHYLRSIRLEKARFLLETSFLSIGEIINQIGTSDQSHFVRDFKKAYGASPSLYRARFQGALAEDPLADIGKPGESK
jgi:transcriptional regulator GlxA family with amidase domain